MYNGIKGLLVLFSLLLFGCAGNQSIIDGNQLAQNGNCKAAIASYEKALKNGLSGANKEICEQSIEKCKQIVVSGILNQIKDNNSFDIASIQKSIALIHRNIRYDDNARRLHHEKVSLDNRLDQLKKIKNLISISDSLSDKKEYHQSLIYLQKALAVDPSNVDLKNRIDSLTSWIFNQKQITIKAIKVILASKSHIEKAVTLLAELKKLDPEEPTIHPFEELVNNERKLEVENMAKQDTSQNQFIIAYKTLQNSGLSGLEDHKNAIIQDGSQYYYKKAQNYAKAKKYYRAYIAIVKAQMLDDNDISIFDLHRKMADIIDKSIQKYIGIPTFGSPSNDKDAGANFSDSLINGLLNKLPYGLSMLERQKIDLLMTASNNDIYHIADKSRVDIMITGNVNLLKVDREITKNECTTKVNIGDIEVPNPTYAVYLKQYGKDVNSWPTIPPVTIKRPQYKVIQYTRGQGIIKAFGDVTVRIFDTNKAAIIYSKTFKDTISKKDDFNDAVAMLNIDGNPLELPTATEMKSELYDDLSSKIVKVVTNLFSKREQRFLDWALYHMKRREYDKTLQYLAQGHLYCIRGNVNNAISKKITDLMINLTEGD